MPYPGRLYRLSFTAPEMQDVHVTLRPMSVGEALSYDEARMTPPTTREQLRSRTEDLAQRLADVVVEWDLLDAKGVAVPITQAGVMSLDDWVMSEIEKGMFQAYRGGSPLAQTPAPAGEAGIESSLPMTPLPEPTSA